jgi:hypothetical protein
VITPGLFRRSLGRALQWRLLLLSLLALLPPVLVAFLPLRGFLGDLLDHAPRHAELVKRLDSSVLVDLIRQSTMPAFTGVQQGFLGALATGLLLLPLLHALALGASRRDEASTMRELCNGAGELYGRMFRQLLFGLLVLGLAGGLAAPLFAWAAKFGSRSLTEGGAAVASRVAAGWAALLVLLAQLINDAARAAFAAEPGRRSALFALGAGARLVVRRAGQALPLLLVTTVPSLLLAAAVMLARHQLLQSTPATVALGFLLGQLATAALLWGHAARLFGLAELHRADLADQRARERFVMAPPRTSPPPLVAPAAAPERGGVAGAAVEAPAQAEPGAAGRSAMEGEAAVDPD